MSQPTHLQWIPGLETNIKRLGDEAKLGGVVWVQTSYTLSCSLFLDSNYIPLPPVMTVVEANEMASSSERIDTAALVGRVCTLEDFFSGSLRCCVGTDELHAFFTVFSWVVHLC